MITLDSKAIVGIRRKFQNVGWGV